MTFDPASWDAVATGRAGGAAWIFQRAIERVAELVGVPEGSGSRRLLDAGCGTGRLAAKLAGAGWDVVALDRNASMLRHAASIQRASHRDRCAGTYRCARADVGTLPFSDAAFSRITASSLVGCLADPDPFFREAHRCLEPGGVLVVTATNARSRLLRLNYMLPRRWVVPHAAGPREQFQSWSRDEFIRRLESAGFRVGACHVFNFVLHVGPWLVPARRAARWADAWGVAGSNDRWGRNLIAAAWKS